MPKKTGVKVLLNREGIVRLMLERNWSNAYVAKRTKLSKGYWSHLLHWDRSPGPEIRDRIQAVFNNVSWKTIFIIVD
jgi:hypothetical protein